MVRLIILLFTALLLTLVVTSCSDSSKQFNKQYERTSFRELTIVLYDSKQQLNEAYVTMHDLPKNTASIEGFAQWSPTNEHKCVLHLVQSETLSDNNNVTTWGHELKHCVYGSFHK